MNGRKDISGSFDDFGIAQVSGLHNTELGENHLTSMLSLTDFDLIVITGDLLEYNLKPGQKLVADTRNVAGFEPFVQMDVQLVPPCLAADYAQL